MGPTNLDDVLEGLGLLVQSVPQLGQSWKESPINLHHSCYMHGRREGVI